jgi:hypothetical protein
VLHILRHARGRYGSTLDYLAETATALRGRTGVRDREIERLMRWRGGTAWSEPSPTAAVRPVRSAGAAARTSALLATLRQVGLGVDVDQHAGVVDVTAMRRVAGDQRRAPSSPSSAISSEYSSAAKPTGWPRRPRYCEKATGCSASASATADAGRRTIGMSPGSTSQPLAAGRSDTPRRWVADAAPRLGVRQHDHVARGDQRGVHSGTSRAVVTTTAGSPLGQCVRQRAAEHGVVAEGLLELVPGAVEAVRCRQPARRRSAGFMVSLMVVRCLHGSVHVRTPRGGPRYRPRQNHRCSEGQQQWGHHLRRFT